LKALSADCWRADGAGFWPRQPLSALEKLAHVINGKLDNGPMLGTCDGSKLIQLQLLHAVDLQCGSCHFEPHKIHQYRDSLTERLRVVVELAQGTQRMLVLLELYEPATP
jgi:hypothetical protein